MISKIYHICRDVDNVVEGGRARDRAFFDFFKQHSNAVNVVFSKKKPASVINVVFLFLFAKNEIFFIHLNTPFFPIHIKAIGSIFVRLYCLLLNILNARNNLIFEVNDLPIEQSVDLQLPSPRNVDFLQRHIFNLLNATFIFASYSMADYAKTRFNLLENRIYVAINGANPLVASTYSVTPTKKYTFSCVYAGTLNRGRSIERVIEIFEQLPHIELVLVGSNGDWIRKEKHKSNIKYVGEKEESEAQIIVSHCDLGIIPYDNTKFYYNIAFPTKVSFYIMSGLPVLITPTKEILSFFDRNSLSSLLYVVEINDWFTFLQDITNNALLEKKELILRNQQLFQWSEIITNTVGTVLKAVDHS